MSTSNAIVESPTSTQSPSEEKPAWTAAPPAERNHKAEALSAAAWSILENEESI